ncbi:DMT family transporter [Actibacterium pelagium]|uniref:Membrane protein n=1 Tax=Actibacterium pelagium TaxID=2029103 RepID=A0A917ALU5_9RHOB|nr:DMT family transporter [Actibacterium pelagium]GGE59824.1 membrane protein [Actibacterium pelagium]
MSLWIPVTIFAAFAQNLRFMLQKHLKSTKLSTTGATFARFLYSFPLVALIVAGYLAMTGQEVPVVNGRFAAFAVAGGLAQILATMCVVALFTERNFAVGITFKKTETLQTALIGWMILGEGISLYGLFAIIVGFVGILLLSEPPEGRELGWKRFFNKATGLGLLSGILFACSATGYRGATLSLGLEDVFLRAAFTLSLVTAGQAAVMAIWMGLREPGELSRVLASWRVAGLVGVFSMFGSLGWFVAFTLQTAAYVKALGQIELLFSFLATTFIFKERTSAWELVAMGFLTASILLLVLLI